MRNRLLAVFAALVFVLGFLSPTVANPKGVPNSNASGYWNEERRNSAVPREFVFEPGAKEGKLVPQARKGGSGGGSATSGTSYWPATQQSAFVAHITGKVFFTMSGVPYVCSGSLLEDGRVDIAIVITAAHCVWENSTTGSFATNWSFWPNYDTDYTNREGWNAQYLYAPTSFTNQSSFNTTATLNDFAFAIIENNHSRLNPAELLPDLGSLKVGNTAYAFGYPQATPFNGQELVFSFGSVSTDRNSGNKTWRISSSLTGGASGGPWYSGYVNGSSVGAVASVNSYKYASDKNSMYGPMFNSLTNELFTRAKAQDCTTTTNVNCKKIL